MYDTHRSLSIHTGNIDNGPFGFNQVGHTELSQVEDRSDERNRTDTLSENLHKIQI